MIGEEENGEGDENNGGDLDEGRGFDNVGCGGGDLLHGWFVDWLMRKYFLGKMKERARK